LQGLLCSAHQRAQTERRDAPEDKCLHAQLVSSKSQSLHPTKSRIQSAKEEVSIMRKDTDTDGDFLISASSLQRFNDCELAWAVGNINRWTKVSRDERQAVSIERPTLFGPIFGTCGHLGTELMLRDVHAGRKVNYKGAVDAAISLLETKLKEAADWLSWDSVTRDENVAIKQLKGVLAEIRIRYVNLARPLLIEAELDCKVASGFKLVGHPDVVNELDDGVIIDDFKFGSKCGCYICQIGAYKKLVYSEYDVEIHYGRVIWVKRTGVKHIQYPMQLIRYDYNACANAVEQTIDNIVSAVNRYNEEIKKLRAKRGDHRKALWAFSRNPDSKFCTRKTCDAWGTSLCDQWIKEVSSEAEDDALLWAS